MMLFSFGGVFLLFFRNGLHPQTLTFSRYYAHLGERLNISGTLEFLSVSDICQHM